jgi:hypothetical protein
MVKNIFKIEVEFPTKYTRAKLKLRGIIILFPAYTGHRTSKTPGEM